jgi:hypothetical protein
MRMRRYEIRLPTRNRDGSGVSDQIIRQTYGELAAQFRETSKLPHTVVGLWLRAGPDLEDKLLQLLVDADDTPESQRFFVRFKAKLRERFGQDEIYIASYPVDIV